MYLRIFTATTATGIGFGNNIWLNNFGENDYSSLEGTPYQFYFSLAQNGIIINEGELSLNPNSSFNLIGGAVINQGNITVAEGNINIVSIFSQNIIEISQNGQILKLEIDGNKVNDGIINYLELPAF
jgi:hypothetical protein